MPQVITDEQINFYQQNGFLILKNILDPAELARVQDATAQMLALARPGMPDHVYKGDTLGRIEYVVDKDLNMQALLAHPFLLRSVEKLMGADFIPTWDAMVMKMPGNGLAVPWHRDAAPEFVRDKPIFNVDIYLDEATRENCVWALPGSHQWTNDEANAWIARSRDLEASPADYAALPDVVPVLMQPGDVMLHDILVLHGSPRTTSERLRRVVYYEFRTAHVENEVGPHTPDYVPLKQAALLGCLHRRAEEAYRLPGEAPFVYSPPAPFDHVTLAPGAMPPTFRYPHDQYWRK